MDFYSDNRNSWPGRTEPSVAVLAVDMPSGMNESLKISLCFGDEAPLIEIRYMNAEIATVKASCKATDMYPARSETRECSVKAVQAALRIASDWDSLGSEEDYRLAETVMSQHVELRWIA